jgi:hypothetical protein
MSVGIGAVALALLAAALCLLRHWKLSEFESEVAMNRKVRTANLPEGLILRGRFSRQSVRLW